MQRGLTGTGLPFWNNIDLPGAQLYRKNMLLKQFKEKYPEFEELPEPTCDW